MAFFQTARRYTEGFALYGDRMGIEWPILEGGPLNVFTMDEAAVGQWGNPVIHQEVVPPDDVSQLPTELHQFVRDSMLQLPGMPEPVEVLAHHGGSHPHLVHEFVDCVVTGRTPRIDDRMAARITAPGIIAHQSALQGDKTLAVPAF